MSPLFEIIQNKDSDVGIRVSLGIKLKIGEYESIFPISKGAASFADFRSETQSIKNEVDEALEKAKDIFEGNAPDTAIELRSDMSPEEIWGILSSMPDTNQIIKRFNTLEVNSRRSVAEHVLTQTNIFSGTGSMFSARYNSETGLLEPDL